MPANLEVLPVIPFEPARLERLMAEAGMDAVLATTRHNVRYLTGGYYNHFFARTARQAATQYMAMVGVTRDLRTAFHVAGRGETADIDRFGQLWIDDRLAAQPGQAMTVNVARTGAAALRRRGLQGATIGVELPFLPADAFMALRQELPAATLVDASGLLGELRAIKRSEELDRLRAVHLLTAEAIQSAMTNGGAGATTRELAAAVARGIGARDAAFLYCLANVGPSLVRTPGDERWVSGRPLHLDAGGELGDYVSDICRMGSFGPEAPAEAPAGSPAETSAEARAMYEACLEAQDRLRSEIAAGLTCGDVQRLGEELLRATRWGEHSRFVAHGLGMVSHEPPDVDAASTRPLEIGMVLSLETEFKHADIGHVKFEDSVAVTASGCVGLGDHARDWCLAGA